MFFSVVGVHSSVKLCICGSSGRACTPCTKLIPYCSSLGVIPAWALCVTHTHQSVSLSLSHFSCFYLIKAKEPGKCTQVWSRYHCKMTQAAAPLDLSKWNKSMSDLLCKCQTAMCKYVQNLTYAKTHTHTRSIILKGWWAKLAKKWTHHSINEIQWRETYLWECSDHAVGLWRQSLCRSSGRSLVCMGVWGAGLPYSPEE